MKPSVVFLGLGVALGVGLFVVGAGRERRPKPVEVEVVDVPVAGTVRVSFFGGGEPYVDDRMLLDRATKDRVVSLALLAAGIPAPRISWQTTEV